MATTAEAPTPTTTDGSRPTLASPQKLLPPARRPIPNPQSPTPEHRTRANRANARLSAGPRTESGKQRSSQNALSHGLTARTAVLPTEDPEAHQRHVQQFLDENQPANATETQLVHEMADTAWRLNRIPFLEADLLSNPPTPKPKSRSSPGLGSTVRDSPASSKKPPISSAIFRSNATARSAAISTRWPKSSSAISAKDFPGTPRLFHAKLASFFQRNKSRLTPSTSFI